MGYYTELSNNSTYAAKDTALANRLNGVNGHTVLGTLLVGNVQNIFSIGEQLAGRGKSKNSSYGPEPENDNSENTQEKIDNSRAFNKALTKFNKTPNKDTAKALEEALENCDTNTARDALKSCKKSLPTLFS